MGKRVLIVGGVAGGASAAARIRRLDEAAEITVFERGPHASYSNCSLPYYLSRTVESADSLIMMSAERFRKQYAIDVRLQNEVVSIDRAAKRVRVKDLAAGTEYEERYDVLILSPGAAPVRPASIPGIGLPHVKTIRNVADITALDAYLKEKNAARVAVIGGGFIGCETAENLVKAGLKVTLAEAASQVMMPFDDDMVQILHKEFLDHGVELCLGDGLAEITAAEIVLKSGKRIPADAVVLAIGVKPETALAKDAGLAVGETGGIKVDHNFRTSDPCIYAVGDAIEVHHRLTGKDTRLALAWPAQMEARAAADHICGRGVKRPGVIGSSVVRVFGLYAASTGLNARQAEAEGLKYDYAYVIPQDKVGIMPDAKPIHLKLIFEVPTGRILGAQAIGANNPDRRIDIIAALIRMGGTLEDARDLELCYAPTVGTAKDAVNMAALVGLNLLEGQYKQVHVSEVRDLAEHSAFILDVREKNEYDLGHIKGAVNVPMSEFRSRLPEIPKDRPVYVHCRSAQRSYNVVMALQHLGYDNAVNISGSYLGICLYEYPRDVLQGREKIVTEYNFK